MSYTCHSGGCAGTDMFWENEGYKYGVLTIAYSFPKHSHQSKNPKVLIDIELKEGYEAAKVAEKELKRPLERITYYPYVKNLISRNWFQVKNSESIFAIGKFASSKQTHVDGGTGWAVQMAIDNNKPVFFFDQKSNGWYEFDFSNRVFKKIDYIPKLTTNFAGIGTRALDSNGENAIKEILKSNFSNSSSSS